MISTTPVALVDDLTVRIHTRAGVVHAATEVSLALASGTITALVGESGCGKSILASALSGLLPAGSLRRGTIIVDGRDMSRARERHWQTLRGRTVGFAPQSAAASFSPIRTIGRQLTETISALDTATTVEALLGHVGLPPHLQHSYPHELSGGMAQRIGLAAALCADPPLLLADEPTAGLDPQATAHVLRLLRAHADRGAAVLLITHDVQALENLGVADDIAVMYAGRIVEAGPATTVLNQPSHDYSRALLAALPSRGLHPIPGLPPELTNLDPTYTFADRAATGRPTQ
ncbi:ABC transporter ATP-binding protein (plasmid) [Rhodococcus sp. 2G]|uniref:ABC transporter ATP-binding protein n=1 Tax=Rhodococcus sp. 2G TaxID=1570939 RepID=UPI000903D1EE|nr:ABC transporter ATP-binding protein [Rhodococcus sp. 2G]APE12759.1 ABC transporter ATP-binding protein [Rhodococcus sp. 2G]